MEILNGKSLKFLNFSQTEISKSQNRIKLTKSFCDNLYRNHLVNCHGRRHLNRNHRFQVPKENGKIVKSITIIDIIILNRYSLHLTI